MALADAGAHVIAAGRTFAKVERTAAKIAERGGSATAVACDVTDVAQVDDCVRQSLDATGRIDVLVNNAQVPPLGPLLSLSDEMFEVGWRSGPLATLRFMRACHPHLKGGGAIVNMGSGSAIRPDLTAFGGYGACKEAIRTLSRAAACEWGKDGIRVNVVLPLALSPGMAGFLEEHPEAVDGVLGAIPLGFIGDALRDVGPAVVWLCSDDARYVTGASLTVDGGQDYVR
ncbi:MAG: hypothetical protein QOC92_116 [Acidimicrobiaceae bacterium]